MDNKKRKHFPVWALFMIVGFALLIIGIITLYLFGADKFLKTVDINESYDGTNITTVNLDMNIGDLKVYTYEGSDIVITAHDIPENRYKIECTDGELKITCKESKWYDWYDQISWNKKTPSFDICLPNKEYQMFRYDAGVGSYEFCDLKFENGDLNLGVGDGVFDNMISTRKIDIDMGVGSNVFKHCDFADADVDTGVGDLNLNCVIREGLDIDTGIGTCKIDIDGNYDDYSIKYDTGIGSYKVDEGSRGPREYTGERIPIEISGGIGEIDLSFR